MWAWSRSREFFKFWEIIDEISERVQARDIVTMPMALSKAEGHFCYFNLCNTHISGNIACFNYIVFTHKLESTRGL